MRFYLGTHQPHWLGKVGIPLFVSHRRLKDRKTLPQAWGPWVLDSGGFTELSMYGEWKTGVDEYVEAVARYREIGNMEWAAPQDWMCEPWITDQTGLSVREHQERTVENYLELRGRGPFIPVVQGWGMEDYVACVDLYQQAGVDLSAEPLVGVGSVCRRHDSESILRVFTALNQLDIKCHGFGVKTGGLRRYGHLLESADSMAWSYAARRSDPLPGCTTHQSCSNCPRYAVRWWADQALVPMVENPVQGVLV